MKVSQETLNYLENLYVKEFRAFQALYNLTKDERLALSKDDVPRLLVLTKYKETLLDQLGQLDESRRTAFHAMGILAEIAPDDQQGQVNGLQVLDKESADRLFRLHEGSLVLISQVRELTRGNCALAASSLERANALIAGQLSPGNTYDPTVLPAIFAAIIAARDALETDAPIAIPTAASDLRLALERATRLLEKDNASRQEIRELIAQIEENQPPQMDSYSQQDETSPVEVIANLYHQGTVYQTMLNVSNRMLSTALT